MVTEVGATLRSFSVGGRDVVHGFAADGSVNGGRGQNLIPWPNRIRDGRYTFDGVTQQLALTEPARHNASHGLARHVLWVLVEHEADSVVNQTAAHPSAVRLARHARGHDHASASARGLTVTWRRPTSADVACRSATARTPI